MKRWQGNTPKGIELEKTKIVFQFTLMLIASVIGGICFSRLIGENAVHSLSDSLLNNFSQILPPQNRLYAFFARFVRVSLPELICILIIFIFSFSFINYITSDAVLIFMGFKFGLNAALIKLATFRAVGIGNSLSFLLIRGILLMIILSFSCKMAIYSLDIRRFSSSNGRVIINHKVLFSMLMAMIGTSLSVLLFNGLYCIFIYIF